MKFLIYHNYVPLFVVKLLLIFFSIRSGSFLFQKLKFQPFLKNKFRRRQSGASVLRLKISQN